jgi:dihydrodipicolinate synthase/N-acetylneuraminate lyase
VTRITRETLHGVWAALILPWTDDDRVDEARFAAEIRAYGGTGIHGIYTGGTTGEFYAQDDATFAQVAKIACDVGHEIGVPVQIGCTALSTRNVLERIRVARAVGADGVQIALPFWLELADDEVVTFMHDVARAAGDTAIILYQTMRAKRRVGPELLGRLARELPTLSGTKDTGCSHDELRAMVAAAPGVAIFGGEHDLIDRVQAGGRGIYSSITGLNARKVVELYKLCASGQFDEARLLQSAIHRYMFELLVPMVREGLWDSAVDRVQRVAGRSDVGLRCQRPYRSATPEHVTRLIEWCRTNTPELLP